MSWVLRQELLRIPFFGWGLRHTRPIAIDREEARAALAQVKQQGQQRLDDGISVLIFPEGTRIEPDQHVEYKPGGALLAAGTGYPALPVAHNTGYFWPRHRFIKRPGIVTVSIGPLIPSQGVKAKSINEQAEQWIEAERQRLPH